MTKKRVNPPTVEEYAQHVTDLARAFKVEMHYTLTPQNAEKAHGDIQTFVSGPLVGVRFATLTLAPITDETYYAIALHELGHYLGPGGTVRVRPEDEDNW